MIARRSVSLALVWLCAAVGALVWCSAPALGQRMHEFSFSFGGEGSGDGQLMQPGQLAVNDETGDVYVLDRGNERVEIFSASGAYVGQFNGSASPTGVFSGPSTASRGVAAENSIAVDNATNPFDPSKGDVYVGDARQNLIDKFSATGVYIGQLAGVLPGSSFSEESLGGNQVPADLAVDSSGALWVQDYWFTLFQFNDAVVNEYVSTLEPEIPSEEGAKDKFRYIGLALDSEDNVYVGVGPNAYEPPDYATEFSRRGEALTDKLDGEEAYGLAVDQSSGDVYVDHRGSVAVYGPSGAPVERFGLGELEASEGIAVDSATGTVYASNAGSQEIDVFRAFVAPDVSTGSVSSVAETSVTVGGVVNPDGLAVTTCEFEYGTSEAYGQSVPCAQSPGSGDSPVTVSAELPGLERLTRYHFRLRVANASGSNAGRDHAFVTPVPVALSEEAVSDVSTSSALFGVLVDPGGAETTYHFEYGTSVSYGSSVPVPAGEIESGMSGEPVSVRVEGLSGDTTYHVRFVASNVLGTVYGPDETFTTQAVGGAFALPDGRAWELVSPPNKAGARILAPGEAGQLSNHSALIESSVDGDAVSYGANAPVGAGVGGNANPAGTTQVLSTRGASGWSSRNITLPQQTAGEGVLNEYQFFSSDLSSALVEHYGAELYSPEATEQTPYLHDLQSGSYTPLVSASDVVPGVRFGPPKSSEDPGVVAATPDLSHMVIGSKVALTSSATEQTSGANLYEWSGGRLQLVNETPEHTVENATLGGQEGDGTRHALSDDGSRVFFETGAFPGGFDTPLYMRDMASGLTVQVDAPAPGVSAPPADKARFEIASADGSRVFFLDQEPLTIESKLEPQSQGDMGGPADLYVCQVVEAAGEPRCDLRDLSVDQGASEAASVQLVVGASEDGSVVYFVANGKLAEGAQPGEDNLYVESETGSSWSAPRLVAVLSGEESSDWSREAEERTSRVSPNGRFVTFMSDRSLTGYDNRDAVSGEPDEEVFLYDEATGGLHCVSCDPTGARPDGIFDGGNHERGQLLVDEPAIWHGRWLAASIPGWTTPATEGKGGSNNGRSTPYQSRVLSDEGRLFFDGSDALVAQDTNGREDVYEYEPVGVGGPGGCTAVAGTYVAGEGGCVSLISSGASGEESVFLDASETGDDVFFLTQASLVSQDVDSSFDVYDAHACREAAPCVSAPVSPPPCTSGDACKPAPSLQPAVFGAPASATFSGSGNVAGSEAKGSASAPKPPVKKKSSLGRRKRKRKTKGSSKHQGRGKGRSGGRGKSAQAPGSLSAGRGR